MTRRVRIMQACLDVVIPYVRDRKQFGKPIGTFQLMQAKIADMYVALNSARALGVALPNTATTQQLFTACTAMGGARWDHSAMVRALETLADHDVHHPTPTAAG